MRISRLGLRTLAGTIGAMAYVALTCLATPKVHASPSQAEDDAQQPRLSKPGYRRASPELLYAAGRPPELTYANPVYGLSFRFPSNFYFRNLSSLGNGPQLDFSPHRDRGEILLASVTIPEGFWMGTNAGGMVLLVGVNPRISMESCAALVAPDEWTSGGVLELTVDGVAFRGRNEIEKGAQYGVHGGVQDSYQRQYTGYSHGLCYEFEIDMWTTDLSRRVRAPAGIALVDLDRVFAELEAIVLTARIQAPNLGSDPSLRDRRRGCVTKPWETPLPFPKELAGLEELADWNIRYPTGAPPMLMLASPRSVSGTGDLDRYLRISFEYDVSSSLDDAAANAAVDKLNADVIQLIQKNGWKPMGPALGAAPCGTSNCYVKDSVFVTTSKGTTRCTMNSPCEVSDILTVAVFIPAPAAGVAH